MKVLAQHGEESRRVEEADLLMAFGYVLHELRVPGWGLHDGAEGVELCGLVAEVGDQSVGGVVRSAAQVGGHTQVGHAGIVEAVGGEFAVCDEAAG